MPEPIERWAAITGRWEFADQQATYQAADTIENYPAFGIALAGKKIRDGQIRTQVRMSRQDGAAAGLLLGYQSLNAAWIAVTLGSFDYAYSVIEFRPGFGFTPLDTAGAAANLHAQKTYDLTVAVHGQCIRMTVDGVEVLNTLLPRPLEGTGVGLYAYGSEKVEFPKTEVLGIRPSAFVIMPFRQPYDSLYRDVISPVADDCGIEIIRIDEVRGPGIILNDIQEQIQRSHVVVAEISEHNANVFYELGYAHALEKPAVLLVRQEKIHEMPFDVRGYRAIPYEDSIKGKKIVERNLEQTFRAVLRGNIETQQLWQAPLLTTPV